MGGGIEGNPFLMRKVPFCCPMGMFLGARSGFKAPDTWQRHDFWIFGRGLRQGGIDRQAARGQAGRAGLFLVVGVGDGLSRFKPGRRGGSRVHASVLSVFSCTYAQGTDVCR